MAREADFDTDLFAEIIRSGHKPEGQTSHSIAETAKQETTSTHLIKGRKT